MSHFKDVPTDKLLGIPVEMVKPIPQAKFEALLESSWVEHKSVYDRLADA